MAIDWSHLPEDVKNSVCFCARAGKHDGWVFDEESGYWVHHKCGKPSVQYSVQECDKCGKTFVPKLYKKIKTAFLGIECDTCDPPHRPGRGTTN